MTNERPVVAMLWGLDARAVRELAEMHGVTTTDVVARAVRLLGATTTLSWTDAAAIREGWRRG